MNTARPHCSELPDLEVPIPTLTIVRHFLIQEDDSSTVEEGFSVTQHANWDKVLHGNNRSTALTETEHMKENWDVTDEDILIRAKEELWDKHPVVEGIKFLLNLIEQRERLIRELTDSSKI